MSIDNESDCTLLIYLWAIHSHFLPDTGNLFSVKTPGASPDVRLETGFIQGDQITVHYDPMIAKLVVHGQDRNDALRRFRRALEQYQVDFTKHGLHEKDG